MDIAREHYHTINGLKTYSRVVGEGEDVVLVHGLSVSTAYWRPAQDALAAEGFRVHALDLPGFGKSQDPRWRPELPLLSGHLHAWLQIAVPRPCHLVGQSLGCEIVVLTALESPKRIKKLVLAAPASLPQLRSVVVQLLSALVDAARERPPLFGAILPAYVRCGPARFTQMLLAQKGPPDGAELARVPHPVLVLRGEKDMVVSRKRLLMVAEALPHAETATIPGAHGAHFTYPVPFARAVASFLRGPA
jgi:pimeloyl-ACP methyl ester carboxylesterase